MVAGSALQSDRTYLNRLIFLKHGNKNSFHSYDLAMKNPVFSLRFNSNRRLPVVHQTEAAECGLACLAMVAHFHGLKIDLNRLRRDFPVSLKGIDLEGLMDTADRLDLSSRALRLELEEMDQLRCPAILHWDLNHFVVLKLVRDRHVVIHDPAVGLRKLTTSEVSKHFSGIALELQPTNKFKPKNVEQRLRLSDLWGSISGLKRTFIHVLLLSLLLQLFVIVSPFYMQTVIDEVIVSQDKNLLLLLALGFLMVKLIQVGTEAMRGLIITYIGAQMNVQIATNLFRHTVRLPLAYFEKRHIGDIVSRFGSLDEIKQMLTTELVEAIVDGVMVIGTLIMMIIYSPILAIIVSAVVLIYLAIRLAMYRRLRQLTEEGIVAKANVDTNFMETIRAMQTVKLFGKEAQRQAVWQNHFTDSVNTLIRLGKFEVAYLSLNRLIYGIENIAVIYFAALMVMGGNLTIGMIFAFMSYKQQFADKSTSLIDKLIQFRMIGLHLERIADIALTKEENDVVNKSSTAEITGKLALSKIGYRYVANEPLLFSGIKMTINPGDSLCLVGPSGCGKTTLMKLMLGLLEPSEGKILIDGVDINSFGLRNYRKQIASVMQDDQLLSGSIADNICFFEPNFDLQLIIECAQLAAIHAEVMAMPMGYASLIGDMGTTLSGGQKQRILLARALYRRPRILFLDEATSHLNTRLERTINANIAALKITRVIIAHRPETITSADRIMLLKRGKINTIKLRNRKRSKRKEKKSQQGGALSCNTV
jgi:ATP-binding cassette subfamily B protein RaxB